MPSAGEPRLQPGVPEGSGLHNPLGESSSKTRERPLLPALPDSDSGWPLQLPSLRSSCFLSSLLLSSFPLCTRYMNRRCSTVSPLGSLHTNTQPASVLTGGSSKCQAGQCGKAHSYRSQSAVPPAPLPTPSTDEPVSTEAPCHHPTGSSAALQGLLFICCLPIMQGWVCLAGRQILACGTEQSQQILSKGRLGGSGGHEGSPWVKGNE